MKLHQRYRTIAAATILLLFWQVFAMVKDNDMLVPYPWQVVQRMSTQVFSVSFYTTLEVTLLRGFAGLIIAFLFALFCAYLSYRSHIFRDLFYPFLLLTRSVPNISYILIVLIIFARSIAVILILFLILFPVIYSNLFSALLHMDKDLMEVMKLYPEKESYEIRRVYLPLLRPSIEASLSAGMSLAFKVGVMAEILGGMQEGIGRELNLCRLNFDMIGMFAWTGWMIFLLVLMDRIIRVCIKEI